MSRRSLALALCLIGIATVSAETKSRPQATVTTWSRSAQPLPYGTSPDPALLNTHVPSPNGKYEIACNGVPREQKLSESVSETLETASCELVAPNKRTPIALELGAEALWSPDSGAVAVTGSDGGAVGTYEVFIYRPQSDPAEIGAAIRRDLARRYPACVGVACSPEERRKLRRDTKWVNVAAIRWVENSDRLLLMAWVPDSSGYGTNLGKLNGYVVDTRSGRILTRYSEQEFKRRFRKYCGDWGL